MLPRFCENDMKKLRSPACCRQENATFSPHIHRTWEAYFCRSLSVHSIKGQGQKADIIWLPALTQFVEEVHFRSRSQIAVRYCDGFHSFPPPSPSSSVHAVSSLPILVQIEKKKLLEMSLQFFARYKFFLGANVTEYKKTLSGSQSQLFIHFFVKRRVKLLILLFECGAHNVLVLLFAPCSHAVAAASRSMLNLDRWHSQPSARRKKFLASLPSLLVDPVYRVTHLLGKNLRLT